MKHTVMIDRENIVYAYSPCHINKNEIGQEEFLPSLVLNDEAKEMGCKMLVVDESDIPEELELWQCEFDLEEPDIKKKLKYSPKKVDFVELSVLRDNRNKAFKVGDKYQLPALQTKLTTEQVQEYSTWRQKWLDAPKTRVEPVKPLWFK